MVCPGTGCRKPFVSQQVNHFLTENMEKLDFECHLCPAQFNYKNALSHLESHNVPRMRCLLKCGDATMFEGAEGMRAHLRDSCAKQKVACTDCQRVLKRG